MLECTVHAIASDVNYQSEYAMVCFFLSMTLRSVCVERFIPMASLLLITILMLTMQVVVFFKHVKLLLLMLK